MQWNTQKTAPETMWRGAVATDQNFAYFTPAGLSTVYRYILRSDEWMKLPQCPYANPGPVVVDDVLTTIGGGSEKSRCTNKLFGLQHNQWSENFPPMITARYRAACISALQTAMNIIVIGGTNDHRRWTTTVEVLNVHNQSWHTLPSLPKPHLYPTATHCGDQLYVFGHNGSTYSLKFLSLKIK